MVKVRKEFISCPLKLRPNLDPRRCVTLWRSALMNPIRLFPPHNLYILSKKSLISLSNAISTCHCAKTILFYYYNAITNSCTNTVDRAKKWGCRCYLIARWCENWFLTFHRCWIRFQNRKYSFLASVCSYQSVFGHCTQSVLAASCP